jgi:hypothetical protein
MSNSSEPGRIRLGPECDYYVIQCLAWSGAVIRDDGTYCRGGDGLPNYECGGQKEALDYANYWVEKYPDRDCVILDRQHQFVQRVARPDLLALDQGERSWWSWLWNWCS